MQHDPSPRHVPADMKISIDCVLPRNTVCDGCD